MKKTVILSEGEIRILYHALSDLAENLEEDSLYRMEALKLREEMWSRLVSMH